MNSCDNSGLSGIFRDMIENVEFSEEGYAKIKQISHQGPLNDIERIIIAHPLLLSINSLVPEKYVNAWVKIPKFLFNIGHAWMEEKGIKRS